MSNNEIITLQFGNYSNYVGSHWWNLQESSFSYNADEQSEINHDVLFREGLNSSREITFTPRLLLVDLKGSLGCLTTCSDLYGENTVPDITEDNVLWPVDKLQIEEASKLEKNEFLDDLAKEDAGMGDAETSALDKWKQRYELDDKVQYWSDYLATRFHPRSFSIVNQFEHSTNTLNSFSQGVELWKSEQFCEEWVDKCRAYAEECDYLQGFHVLFDCADGFSGLSCSALSHLEDEYANKAVFAFPTQAAYSCNDQNLPLSLRIVNNVLAYSELVELSSAFVPLSTACDLWNETSSARSFPNLRYNEKLSYHSSGILAAYLETISVGYRRRKTMSRFAESLSQLTPCGRKLLTGSLRLPFPVYPELSILESLEMQSDSFWTTITPNANVTLETSPLQEIGIRGLSSFSLLPSAKKRSTSAAYQFQSVEEMILNYLNFCTSGPGVRANIANIGMPLKVPASYPSIFEDNVTRIGCISETTLPLKFAVTEAPVFAGLHNCSSASNLLNILSENGSKIGLNYIRCFPTVGLEKLEYLESVEKVLTLKDNYC